MGELYCPFCRGATVHTDLELWDSTARTTPEDPANSALLAEHQCDVCGASFWTTNIRAVSV